MNYTIRFARIKLYSPTLLLLVLFFYGCANLAMELSKGEIQQLKLSEGVVVGSVIVNIVSESAQKPGWWPLINIPLKTENRSFGFFVKKMGSMTAYKVTAIPGKEKMFISKLEKGEYAFYCFRLAGMGHCSKIDVRFVVVPGMTTYIGRFVVTVPPRIFRFAAYGMWVEDAQGSVIKAMKEKYGEELEPVRKRLMRAQPGPRLF